MDRPEPSASAHPPLGLRLFTYALLCSGCAINGVFVSLAVPAMAPYGVTGMLFAALIGGVIGVLPARWLANSIWAGLKS